MGAIYGWATVWGTSVTVLVTIDASSYFVGIVVLPRYSVNQNQTVQILPNMVLFAYSELH